jgi:very-short-patch-repair endonuclease
MTDLGHRSGHIRRLDGPGDELIAELAHRQHGRVAHRQLRELGFTTEAIRRRVESRRLIRLYRGVYAVGHASETAHGAWIAAVLACGDGAVLSHRSAAALYGILSDARATIDVTTKRGRAGHPGIRLHRVRTLHEEDVTVVDGIPVTSVARTLLDLAETVPLRLLRRAVEQAEKLGLFDLTAVERVIARSSGRRGVKPLRAVLAERIVPADVRSELERLLPEICRAAGLPQPALNVSVAGRVVDALFAREKVVVELDGYRWHRSPAELERDDETIVALKLAGYRVLRFTYGQVTQRPDYVAASIREALSQAAAPSRLSA